MALRLAEAQQLSEGLDDPLLRPALQEFLRAQHIAHVSMLLTQIRQKDRDVMKEAALAGKVDVYETLWSELEHFSKRALKEAAQL